MLKLFFIPTVSRRPSAEEMKSHPHTLFIQIQKQFLPFFFSFSSIFLFLSIFLIFLISLSSAICTFRHLHREELPSLLLPSLWRGFKVIAGGGSLGCLLEIASPLLPLRETCYREPNRCRAFSLTRRR